MANKKLNISARVDMTINIKGMDFIKPGIEVGLNYDEFPTKEELEEDWNYIWDDQVGPQSEKLIGILTEDLERRERNKEERRAEIAPKDTDANPYD